MDTVTELVIDDTLNKLTGLMNGCTDDFVALSFHFGFFKSMTTIFYEDATCEKIQTIHISIRYSDDGKISECNKTVWETNASFVANQLFIEMPPTKNKLFDEILDASELYHTCFINRFLLYIITYSAHHALLNKPNVKIYVDVNMVDKNAKMISVKSNDCKFHEKALYAPIIRGNIQPIRCFYAKYMDFFEFFYRLKNKENMKDTVFNDKVVIKATNTHFKKKSAVKLSTLNIPPVVYGIQNPGALCYLNSFLHLLRHITHVILQGSPIIELFEKIKSKTITVKEMRKFFEDFRCAHIFKQSVYENVTVEGKERQKMETYKDKHGKEHIRYTYGSIGTQQDIIQLADNLEVDEQKIKLDSIHASRYIYDAITDRNISDHLKQKIIELNPHNVSISHTIKHKKEMSVSGECSITEDNKFLTTEDFSVTPHNNYLLFRVDTFGYNETGTYKLKSKVYPDYVLNWKHNKFILVSVVVHSGSSIYSGHYMNYSLNKDKNGNVNYYKYNDSSVSLIGGYEKLKKVWINAIDTTVPYLILYKRI